MGDNRWRAGSYCTRSRAIQRVEVAIEIGDQEVYESCTLDKATRIKITVDRVKAEKTLRV